MGHVPKGVIGIRMDGVTGVHFDDLEIYDLQEHGDLGSDLCGEYWTYDMSEHNHGGGNIFQNEPYLYGYTGNYVHGIFSDFAVMEMSGDIKLYDMKSDTGLTRGLALYLQTTLSFADEATLSISGLSAGHGLYDTDTSSLHPPYNPTISTPIHVVEQYEVSNKLFNTTIINAPKLDSVSCIYGRDGIDTSSYELTVDNSNCGELEKEIAALIRSSPKSSSPLKVNWVAIRTVVVLMALISIIMFVRNAFYSLMRRKSKSMDTECDPLLQSVDTL